MTPFELADRYVTDACLESPVLATGLGVPGSDGEWGADVGLSAVHRRQEQVDRYLPLITPHLNHADPTERLAAKVMHASLLESQASLDSGDHFRSLRHLGSPFHRIRSVFDQMDSTSAAGAKDIVSRLAAIERPVLDYRDLLDAGVDTGNVAAQRQVRSILAQIERMSGPSGSLEEIATKVRNAGIDEPGLDLAVEHAKSVYREFADWLEANYLPHAGEDDAVGRDVYIRAADTLVGLAVDPVEAYAWGWTEFRRLLSEMQQTAEEIIPGAGVLEVKEFLETDPSVTVKGTGDLLRFVAETLDRAVDELSGTHFAVPDAIRPLTVQLAPTGSPLGVYYVRPSEDLSRPGGVWYSIGEQEVFPLYQHVSTAYHEGFPGHHLQIATAMHRSEELSRFQRLMTWYPGYGEGWAMYAEVLMGELGYLDNPQHYFGMLAKQMYRASRVVVDIGLHLEKGIPESAPIAAGEQWSFDIAVEYMTVYGFRTPAQARDEVLRYLGWPGQAIAYKLGEQEILSIRDEAKRLMGDEFDLRPFHQAVLGHGAMRLDLLRDVVMDHLT